MLSHPFQQIVQCVRYRQVVALLEKRRQARPLELLVRGIQGFVNSIGESKDSIPRLRLDLPDLIVLAGKEGRQDGSRRLELSNPFCPLPPKGRWVAGVEIPATPVGDELAIEQRRVLR